MDNGLLYINENSLSKEFCNDMIKIFEVDTRRYAGVTASGMNTDIKDSTDLVISNFSHSAPWDIFLKTLKTELQHNVMEYTNKLTSNCGSSTRDISLFGCPKLHIPSMQMQKYDANIGKYIYHNDYQCNFNKKDMRQITFMWYINDVEEGGETEFWKDQKIKPTAGKLVLFPAHWTFPHRALVPISGNKYIITGWIYEDYSNSIDFD
jgi:Rps23 Pro-64 3,4-dihydroxylase Tpa1-like proline 4-hydroxylase